MFSCLLTCTILMLALVLMQKRWVDDKSIDDELWSVLIAIQDPLGNDTLFHAFISVLGSI